MKNIARLMFALSLLFPGKDALCQGKRPTSVSVPVILDHNRMLVDAEIQRKDGSWRKARLWIDTGNPRLFFSPALARDLGIAVSQDGKQSDDKIPSPNVRIGEMILDFRVIEPRVMTEPFWIFSEMHNDGNLPSTVLKRYQVVFDYPKRRLTLAEPGSLQHRGERSPASVHPQTGIVQIDAVVDGDSISFALDNGASFSFVDEAMLENLSRRHPGWQKIAGTAGCANMWGWWPPHEETMTVMRLPEIRWGSTSLDGVALVGAKSVADGGPMLGAWYSRKTEHPVAGFLGPNAFKGFRVEIDYPNSAVYFERGSQPDSRDLDIVGLTLRPEEDGTVSVLGVPTKEGRPVVEGVQPGDKLLQVDGLKTTGATMGTVVDALRGKPGDIRVLTIERNGKPIRVNAKVEHLL